ncbi:Branched-chain alpha-keto acid dehydrogenase, E1 component, alpha subunit [hydrothermal vent metagenome]|uniref:Branched-chain alpha-keto acid dehydrogenase, E1 component, alpha subunit n=1 Tax=hydrothermal vent metagenome TaxID=652676 RepID=A0A3B0RZX1_9ZZZZ
MFDTPLQRLTPNGDLLGESPLPLEEIRRLYQAMLSARVYDRKCSVMQRQGRLATYAQFEGQEASQIGAVAALRKQDWVVGTYRDAGAMWFHGYPWVNLILGRTGDERGGRAPDGVNVTPPSITVGGHMIHAVGTAWASRIKGDDSVSLTFFGDGATSEGDFHEAMNFAGVYKTPTIFMCQNNGWAISMPRDRQTASKTIAHKSIAYGVAGALVDGNDLLAVYEVCKQAVDRARAGEGATLIEALTYRMGPHTTTDDPSRYRTNEGVEEWSQKDPIERVRRYLESEGAWDPAWQDEVESEESDRVETAVSEAEALTPWTADEIFAGMFAEIPPHLAYQQSLLRRRP